MALNFNKKPIVMYKSLRSLDGSVNSEGLLNKIKDTYKKEIQNYLTDKGLFNYFYKNAREFETSFNKSITTIEKLEDTLNLYVKFDTLLKLHLDFSKVFLSNYSKNGNTKNNHENIMPYRTNLLPLQSIRTKN